MKVKVSVSTNKVGSGCEKIIELDDAEFEGMDEFQKCDHIEELAQAAMFTMINWEWEEVE